LRNATSPFDKLRVRLRGCLFLILNLLEDGERVCGGQEQARPE
jgi:hypothetical protein